MEQLSLSSCRANKSPMGIFRTCAILSIVESVGLINALLMFCGEMPTFNANARFVIPRSFNIFSMSNCKNSEKY